jgi:cell division protein FtsL
MKREMTSAEEKLVQARENLHQEWAGLQILGRALTEQEKQRSEALRGAIKLIDEALTVLGLQV